VKTKTFFLKTFGCTLNQSDGELIAALAKQKGFKRIQSESGAGAVIVNSCGVKPATEEKIVAYIQKLARANPKRKLIVCGCLPAINFRRVRAAAPNAFVFGAASPEKVVKALNQARPAIDLAGSEASAIKCREKTKIMHGLIARIPIAYGCKGACAFCGTRAARGALASVPLRQVIKEVSQASKNRALEIRLTAQDAGCWGQDLNPKQSLVGLLKAINALPGGFLCRVGMMNPEHARALMPALAKEIGGPRMFRFIHLPLQSGSDAVLKAMNRPYKVKEFKALVKQFRRALPDVMIATDVIVGFPTETDRDFKATLKVMKEVQFDLVNVSKYGARPTAPASKLKALPDKIVKKRAIEALTLARSIAAQRNQRFIGHYLDVRFAEAAAKGGALGRTREYAPVVMKRARLGEIRRVKIRAASAAWLE
jgi:MiaB/RimO family radical SAM methylthiotransferase